MMRLLYRLADPALRAELAAEQTARRDVIEKYAQLRETAQELDDARIYISHLQDQATQRSVDLQEAQEERDRAVADRERACRIAPVIADLAHQNRTNPVLVQAALLLACAVVRERRRADALALRYDELRDKILERYDGIPRPSRKPLVGSDAA